MFVRLCARTIFILDLLDLTKDLPRFLTILECDTLQAEIQVQTNARQQNTSMDGIAENLHVRVEVGKTGLAICKVCSSCMFQLVTAADQEHEAVADEADCHCSEECSKPASQSQAHVNNADQPEAAIMRRSSAT